MTLVGLCIIGAMSVALGVRVSRVRIEYQVGREGNQPIYEDASKYELSATVLVVGGMLSFASGIIPLLFGS